MNITEPKINVGILTAGRIDFSLPSPYRWWGSTPQGRWEGEAVGPQSATNTPEGVEWQGRTFNELVFDPGGEGSAPFEVKGVVIGIGFHWERREDQRFGGSLKIICDEGRLTAINVIGVEPYLASVISSEMSATASAELLKAHSVISRSWLLASVGGAKNSKACTEELSPEAVIRWYERTDHTLFDVCADDHCQRYQGVTRASTPAVGEAVEATRGEVLLYGEEICDARFSKCCGGAFEEFESGWAPIPHPYLAPGRDFDPQAPLPDLHIEAEAEKWIRSSPEAFCNTSDGATLRQVLNNYDQETKDFYRWKVEYTAGELSELVRRRTGIDFGEIMALEPVERGASARLVKLRIVGTRRTLTVGKELEIRRALSPSHLRSSAFVVDKMVEADGSVRFILTGAGWGHGVGLCQIGAAVMGERGYDYRQILSHYYKGVAIEKIYR